jgi:hypothetical protein
MGPSVALACAALGCDSDAIASNEKDHLRSSAQTTVSFRGDVETLERTIPPIPSEIDIRPANGDVFSAPTSDITISFSGFATKAGQAIEVQVLGDPNAAVVESSWVTIAKTQTATTPTSFNDEAPIFRWSVQAAPAGDPDHRRWPQGGILRYRAVAIDAAGARAALPFFDASSGICVARLRAKSWKDILTNCKSPFSPDFGQAATERGRAAALVSTIVTPDDAFVGPAYLARKGEIFEEDTDRYYDDIDAPRTLRDFQLRFGFSDDHGLDGGSEVEATYYNRGDLGIGREMHCSTFIEGVQQGTACYVRNYGVDDQKQPLFGGDPSSALADALDRKDSFATVAMIKFGNTYAPPEGNDVQFFVYNAQDVLVNKAQLDNVGENQSIPNNCLNCHGGTYDAISGTLAGATFLPFDPLALDFATKPGFTYEDQEDQLRALNLMVRGAGAPPPVVQFIDGTYGNKPDVPGTRADLDWIPRGWNADEESRTIYRDVIKPYCRTCHISQVGDFAFMRIEDLKAEDTKTKASVCETTDMPVAQATLNLFWQSSARAYVVNSLGLTTACAPPSVR